MPSKQRSPNADNSRTRSAWQVTTPRLTIIYVAVLYSFAPLLFEWTAQNSNPFFYNAAVRGVQAAVMAVWLRHTYRATAQTAAGNGRSIFGTSKQFRDVVTHPLDLFRYRDTNGRISMPSSVRDWALSPVVWAVLANFTYAFYVWSTQLVATAVATTIFELYPAVMIIAFNYFARRDNDLLAAARNRLTPTRITCLAFTPVGVGLVVLSQTDGFQGSFNQYLHAGLGGIGLAVIAAVLSGLSPVATIRFGQRLALLNDPEAGSATAANGTHRLLVLWLSIFGFCLVSLLSVPVNVILGLRFGGAATFDLRDVVIGSVIGGVLLFGIAGILERKANVDTDDSTINAGYYLTPVLALVWLAIVGIEIARFGLFVAGAAMLVVLVTVIQADTTG